MYILHSKMASYARKVEEAESIARKAIAQSKRPLVSFSGGKDSIAMLDIICKAGFKGEMVFFKYGLCTDAETPKETLDIVEHYADRYGLKCNMIPCLGEFDCWDELGCFCIFPETPEEKRVFNRTNSDYKRRSKEFQEAYGCDMSFIGMRRDESKRRAATLFKKGSIYTTKDRESATCCPVAGFTGMDVWTYIFCNGLRYPSFYDYPHRPRERIRNEPCLLYTDSIFRHGEAEVFKDIFPDYMAEIRKRYPDTML